MPIALLLVRHGESAGNVARDRALAENLEVIDIAQRDCDVPLSQRGEKQACALGDWLAENYASPDIVLVSPYVRAQQSARLMSDTARWTSTIRVDERFREKEFGMLDRLTRAGIASRFPDQAEMRRRLGKFYYRPPGGESWADVVLRLRSAVASMQRELHDARVAIVTHQVVVLCMRYILEDLSEAQILEIDREGDVANCSITTYEYSDEAPHKLALSRYNETVPLQQRGAPVTAEPDVPLGPK